MQRFEIPRDSHTGHMHKTEDVSKNTGTNTGLH